MKPPDYILPRHPRTPDGKALTIDQAVLRMQRGEEVINAEPIKALLETIALRFRVPQQTADIYFRPLLEAVAQMELRMRTEFHTFHKGCENQISCAMIAPLYDLEKAISKIQES